MQDHYIKPIRRAVTVGCFSTDPGHMIDLCGNDDILQEAWKEIERNYTPERIRVRRKEKE